MKKTLAIILTIIISLLYIDKFDALTGYTTATNVTVRTEPRVADETFIYELPSKNTILDIVEEKLYNIKDPKCDVGWYKINYEGNERYVCGKWVSIGNLPDNNPNYNETSYEARIYGTSIFVRQNATTGSKLKATLLPGTNIRILGDKVSGYGCSAGWYHISYYKNDTGYVCSTYVRTKEELTATDPEYEKELKNSGFPDTYIPYLVKLHQMHPNWKFNAIQTRLDWNKLVTMEDSRNVVNSAYINSTVRDVYTKGYYSETGYEITTSEVNAFFLDPRNFLTEKFIFMFEALGYDYKNDDRTNFDVNGESEKNYFNSLTKMLDNSYLNTDEYKNIFVKAGFDYKVSPIHLAGRVIQEGGSNSSYVAITGTAYDTYKYTYNDVPLNGYYNYYNIGAYGDNPVKNGLGYACGSKCGFPDTYGRPWDTREKAIRGGAEFISGDYISVGQNTLYFEKFDIKNFWHQYQTNITAPATEGVSSFEGYRDAGLLDMPIEFDIPIYLNMPNVVSLPEIASTINTLKDIKINDKLISGFDTDVIEYTYYVPKNTTNITIEATKTDDKSTIKGIGNLTLNSKETEHQIIVTAENGSTRTYRITFIKIDDNRPDATITIEEIIEGLSVKTNNDIMFNISPNTVANTLVQTIQKKSPNTTITLYNNSKQTIEGTSLIETGGQVKITVPTGTTKTFTTVVKGDTSGDGQTTILDLLQIQKHLVGTTKLTNNNLKAADTSGEGEVTILDLLQVQKYIKGEWNL